MTFNALASKCIKPKPKRVPGRDWISKETWQLIAKLASLLRSGHIRQDTARRMKHKIGAAIKADKCKLTTNVGNLIIAELSKRDVKEAFWHLKGWYRWRQRCRPDPAIRQWSVRLTRGRNCMQSGLYMARHSQQMEHLLPLVTIN
jgi:hypothetical protein